jgi:hypothetical protein
MLGLIAAPFARERLPEDLRAWIGKDCLARLTLAVAQTIEWPQTQNRQPTGTLSRLRPQMMLSLLTYCYAIGVHASQEIESGIGHDQTMRHLSAGACLTWHDLRGFRRRNRARLQQALTKLFRIAWRLHLMAGGAQSPESGMAGPAASCRWGQPRLEGQLLEAAEERIARAVLLDSAALDD